MLEEPDLLPCFSLDLKAVLWEIIRTMLDWSQCREVERSPQKVSGAWVFRGSRVPVQSLFENLQAGASIEDFLEWFPGVERQQVEAVLEYAKQSLAEIPG
jgi:uncharacterized protein (DUF433 family)